MLAIPAVVTTLLTSPLLALLRPSGAHSPSFVSAPSANARPFSRRPAAACPRRKVNVSRPSAAGWCAEGVGGVRLGEARPPILPPPRLPVQ